MDMYIYIMYVPMYVYHVAQRPEERSTLDPLELE